MQKKLIFGTLILILGLLLIFGCTSTKYDSQAPILNKSGQVLTKVNSYGLNQPFTVGNLKYTIKNVTQRETIGSEYNPTQAKGQFEIFEIEIENIGNKPEALSSSRFAIIDNNQRRFESGDTFALLLDPEFKNGQSMDLTMLNPGLKQTSYLSFDIPLNLEGNLGIVDNVALPTEVAWVIWNRPDQAKVNNADSPTIEFNLTDGAAFQRGSEIQLHYKIYNITHNGKYDINIYEKLFSEDGNQLWPDYDIGQQTGQNAEPIGFFAKFTPTNETFSPGKYTFEVTVFDNTTDKNSVGRINFNLE